MGSGLRRGKRFCPGAGARRVPACGLDAVHLVGAGRGGGERLIATYFWVRDEPLIMGVDVGRFGDDPSIIRFRQGRDARSIPPIKLRGADTMELAARITDESARFRADAIFIDGGGVGGGVVDRCRQIGLKVTEVQFGAKSDRAPVGQDRPIGYANKRAEIWGNMRDWLRTGAIDNDPDLLADLTGVEYGYVLRNGRDAIQLERKEDMKRRGLASPNDGDALALSFAYPVVASSVARSRRPGRFHRADYDPLRDYERDGGDGLMQSDPAAAEWLRGRALGLPFADDDDREMTLGLLLADDRVPRPKIDRLSAAPCRGGNRNAVEGFLPS